jgi:nucleolar protein 14
MRRATLLPELQRRHKIGGLVDRRIGEGDPGLTAEERAVQRYAEEKQRRKGGNLFDLEGSDDDEPRMGLTHGGRTLDDLAPDDFEALSGNQSDGSEEDDRELIRRKRRREDVEDDGMGAALSAEEADDEPERKKSRREVMQEVVAKSKLHKYERQKTKEDDDELREELDKGMDDMLALLRGHKPAAPPPQPVEAETGGPEPAMDPERLKLLNGADRETVAKEYDSRLKQLASDQRAKPSERTKTDEEKIREEADRLKNLEEQRAKRMRGEQVSDDEANDAKEENSDDDDDLPDEAAEFGFTSSNMPEMPLDEKIVLDDEDDFEVNDNLIAGDSEVDTSDVSEDEMNDDINAAVEATVDDEEDEFVKGALGDRPDQGAIANREKALAFTYPCPRSHQEVLRVVGDSEVDQLPTIIQRIRALHHPSLSATNKEAMAVFSAALVEHLSYMGTQKHSFAVTEQVIRHLHSLSRTYHQEIAAAFRMQLQQAHERKDLHAGDLVILTAIGSIYPTSDHFHQVVTPAIMIMAKWLAMNMPDTAQKQTTGVFVVALCLHYQRLSKRYIPEAVQFTLRALSPTTKAPEADLSAHLTNLTTMTDLWKQKLAFIEIFSPFLKPLSKLPSATRTHRNLTILLSQARTTRRPLQLHSHRPLAIRTSIPKFEDAFNPEKHYDPDKDRSDAKKLQREYKREKKGAIRELRKDASFLAREGLREKKERDREYERKQRRLIAEIQGEEGREAKEYEREKGRRKKRVGR